MRRFERNWLTTQEVADLEDVHPKTVQRWINDGVLPATRTPGGRVFRIPKDYADRLAPVSSLPSAG